MNLKRNDKIILIAGVSILIIAGIGIAVYTSPDTDDIEAGDTQPDYMSYSYNWIRENGEDNVGDSVYVDKSSTYSDSISIESSRGSVLTNVEIHIVWEDDYTHGILRRRGEDTLTVTITGEDGTSESLSSVGGENMTFNFGNINDIPSSDSILAEDQNEAIQIIEGMIDDQNMASFSIEADIETGERLFRPLKFIRDKGNDFQIKVKYTYYSYELEEPVDDTDDDIPTNDDGSNIGLGDFYKNLCYGRSMI